MVDKWIKTILALVALLVFLALFHSKAQAQQKKWELGTDIGFLAHTLDDTVFTLSMQGDYYVNNEVSVGPQLLISPVGDLTQITFAGMARYHIPIGAISLVPFGGLGFVYADLERGRINDDDISYILPLGTTAIFPVSQKFSLASTLLFTFHDLDIHRRRHDDHFNIGLLFGFRFHP